MSMRQLVPTLALVVVAELTLLGVIVFLGEPQRVGGSVPHLTAVDIVYIATPFVLVAAAAVIPVRTFLRRRRGRG